MKTDRTHELVDLLVYDAAGDQLVWVAHPNDSTKNGCRADVVNTHGGRQIWFCGKAYNAAKIVWFKVHGRWPAQKLIYVDGNPANVAISNLKEAGAFDHSRGRKRKTVTCTNKRAKSSAYFKQRYGITLSDYETMFASQNGVCAICKKPETVVFRGAVRNLCVDHDHVTGQVRSLLCHACNVGLGSFRDDPTLLDAGAAYLRQHARPANVMPLKKEFGL